MEFIKRYCQIFILLSLSFISFSQNNYSPFKGTFYIGSGVSSVIDFNSKSLGYKIPFQIGFHTQKTINREDFIDIGLGYSSKGMRDHRNEEINFGTGTMIIVRPYEISINAIELSINYFKVLPQIAKVKTYYYFGITGTYLVGVPDVSAGYYLNLSSEYFRKFYPLFLNGIGLYLNDRVRLDFGSQFFILPLVKKEYMAEFEEITDYFGPYCFPVAFDMNLNFSLDR